MKISPEALREALRLKPDTTMWDECGDHIWLKKYPPGQGIGHCCFVDDPCDWHASFPRYLRGEREALENAVPGEGPLQIRRIPEKDDDPDEEAQ